MIFSSYYLLDSIEVFIMKISNIFRYIFYIVLSYNITAIGYAEETSASEVSLIPTESELDAITPTVSTKLIPQILVSLVDDVGFRIHIKGISEADVTDYLWNGESISEVLATLIESDAMQIESTQPSESSSIEEQSNENEIGFNLFIKINDPEILAGNPIFGVVLSSGIIISKPLIVEFANDKCGGVCTAIVVGSVSGIISNIVLSPFQKKGNTEVYGNLYTKKEVCWTSNWCSWRYRKYVPTGNEKYQVKVIDQNRQKYVFKGEAGGSWNKFTDDYHFYTKPLNYCDDVWITVRAYSEYEGRWKTVTQKSDTWNCFPYESNDQMDIYID